MDGEETQWATGTGHVCGTLRIATGYLYGDIPDRTHSKQRKSNYPRRNLMRSRCRIALATNMPRRMEAMECVVRGCAHRLR